MAEPRRSSRLVAENSAALQNLGLLADLSGTWTGEGFNLIARPDFHDNANLYLQLNQTQETLAISQIGSEIPNRGFGQDDIDLFGLSYLQKIHDGATGAALHLEPGLWVTQPFTIYPPEEASAGDQIIARMASIPHGNAVLAQGTASSFTGPPTLPTETQPYAFSVFPSFNSTPFGIPTSPPLPPTPPPPPPAINAVGSSEKLTAPQIPAVPFHEYDLGFPANATNPRTPFDTTPPEPDLPAEIDGVLMQDVINDPARLLQAVISEQVASGHTFQGVALNIATQANVTFLVNPDSPKGPATTVGVTDGAGGIENIPFLEGGEPTGVKGPNAQTALVYATFWIEKVTPKVGRSFMQLQYAQMTVLNFPILTLLPTVVLLGWPHVSVATLRKAFN
jgi:hypothetical protein